MEKIKLVTYKLSDLWERTIDYVDYSSLEELESIVVERRANLQPGYELFLAWISQEEMAEILQEQAEKVEGTDTLNSPETEENSEPVSAIDTMTKREQLLNTIHSILPCTADDTCSACELSQSVEMCGGPVALCVVLEAVQNGLTFFERGE